MTAQNPQGIGGLMHQSHYVYQGSRAGRYAARFYRPIIFTLAVAIVLITLYQSPPPPLLLALGLWGALIVYAAVFLWRMRMPSTTEQRFYNPLAQFLRGQFSLLGVTFMIVLVTAYGYTNHTLWILYVLATLIISEHNSSKTVLVVLFETAIFYFAASFLGAALYSNSLSLTAFLATYPNMGVHILAIWLVTFVFHYLVSNIRGRNLAFEQHRKWLGIVSEQLVATANPQDQHQALRACAAELTEANVTLWIPRLPDWKLTNEQGLGPDPLIQRATQERKSYIVMQQAENTRAFPGRVVSYFVEKLNRFVDHTLGQPPHGTVLFPANLVQPHTLARIIVPIHRQEDDQELLGVLDLSYPAPAPPRYKLTRDRDRLLQLAEHARLILISSRRQEQLQREKCLAGRLSSITDLRELSRQIVHDVVHELGFGLASISLVDNSEGIIRCHDGINASWIHRSIHSLAADDVQCLVVREGRTYQNDGTWTPCLDRRIWRKYQHRLLHRVWVPILSPTPTHSPYPALGTIEAGFHHRHRTEIPADMVDLLQRYATHAGVALASALQYARDRELTNRLKQLHDLSKQIQRAAAFYEPLQMARLIGQAAEDLLGAVVMLYAVNEEVEDDVQLLYVTEDAILGKGDLIISMEWGILRQLCETRTAHFSSNARRDPLLVNMETSQSARRRRTFTQRQNIKSFVGLPLLGKRDSLIGFLCINYRRRHEFYPEEKQLIHHFAEQAAVALEESGRHRQARSLAITQERSHLAAELHHTLSQQLYGLKQYTKAACVYAERADMSKAVENLHKVQTVVNTSLNSLQHILNELHERPQSNFNFVEDISAHSRNMQALCEIDIRLETCAPAGQAVLPQVQFYLARIAREAINNAVRHAHCTRIDVTYRAGPGGITTLTVLDDGCGFDLERARQSARYGLTAMYHFAHQLNSQLEIDSTIGQGTRLQVVVQSPEKGGGEWVGK